MQKNQNLKVSKIYKTLSFSLLLGLTTAVSPVFGQEWSRKTVRRIEKTNQKGAEAHKIKQLYFNQIEFVSSYSIVVRDLETGIQRTIKPDLKEQYFSQIKYGLYLGDNTGIYGNTVFLSQDDICSVLSSGDIIAVDVNTSRIRGNTKKGLGGWSEPKINAEEYYMSNTVLSSKVVSIKVPYLIDYIMRKYPDYKSRGGFESTAAGKKQRFVDDTWSR